MENDVVLKDLSSRSRRAFIYKNLWLLACLFLFFAGCILVISPQYAQNFIVRTLSNNLSQQKLEISKELSQLADEAATEYRFKFRRLESSTENPLHAIALLPESLCLIAGGQNRMMYRGESMKQWRNAFPSSSSSIRDFDVIRRIFTFPNVPSGLATSDSGEIWYSNRCSSWNKLELGDEEKFEWVFFLEEADVLFAVSRTGNIYRSLPGKHIEFSDPPQPLGFEATTMAYDPVSEILYMAGKSNQIAVSKNRGKSWNHLKPDLAQVESVDHLIINDGGLLAAVAFNDGAAIIRSKDGGKTWEHEINSLGVFSSISRRNDNYIIASNSNEIFRIEEDGAISRAVTKGVTNFAIRDIAHLSNSEILAVGRDGLAILSVDGGRTWRHLKLPNDAPDLHGVQLGPDKRTIHIIGDRGETLINDNETMESFAKVRRKIRQTTKSASRSIYTIRDIFSELLVQLEADFPGFVKLNSARFLDLGSYITEVIEDDIAYSKNFPKIERIATGFLGLPLIIVFFLFISIIYFNLEKRREEHFRGSITEYRMKKEQGINITRADIQRMSNCSGSEHSFWGLAVSGLGRFFQRGKSDDT